MPRTGPFSKLQLTFTGLEPFEEDLSFDLLCPYTVLVGPNGTGKTRILEAIAKIFTFLHEHEVWSSHHELESKLTLTHSTAPRFATATLEIGAEGTIQWPSGEEIPAKVTIRLVSDNDRVKLSRIDTDGLYIDFSTFDPSKAYATAKMRGDAQADLAKQEEVRRIISKAMLPIINANGDARALFDPIQTKLEEKIACLKRLATAPTRIDSSIPPISIDKLRGTISELQLPAVRILQGLSSRGLLVRTFEKSLSKSRSAAYSNLPNSPHNHALARVSQAVKMATTLDDDRLMLDGRSYSQSSLGTQIAVSFLALDQLSNDGDIVLWDEPETGLHPSWCVRVSETMQASKLRYFVGTHRTEFLPRSPKGTRVIRLNREFDIDAGNVLTKALNVSSHLELLDISQRLGLEPSRSLFTANSIIWVEGPTDAIYWRAWVQLQDKKTRGNSTALLEGFDYAFCFTSGSLLAHMSPLNSADQQKLIELLRISPAALVVADSDLDESANESVREKILEGRSIGETEESALKPRVQAFFRATRDPQVASRAKLILTAGREVEDALTDDAFRRTLEAVLGDEPGVPTSPIAATSPWDGYSERLEKFANTPKTSRSRKSSGVEKIEFATTFSENPSLDDLTDSARKRVEFVTNWIREVRDKHHQ